MNEFFKCALWALVTSVPITITSLVFGSFIAHSDGLVKLLAKALLFPFITFMGIANGLFKGDLSDTSFIVIALFSQFLFYLVTVFVVRFLHRKLRANHT